MKIKGNRITGFEIAQEKYGSDYELYAVLREEIQGKKKYGRKMLATKRVKIRSNLKMSEASSMMMIYSNFVKFYNDVERIEKIISKNDLEIDEDMNKTFIDATSRFLTLEDD